MTILQDSTAFSLISGYPNSLLSAVREDDGVISVFVTRGSQQLEHDAAVSVSSRLMIDQRDRRNQVTSNASPTVSCGGALRRE